LVEYIIIKGNNNQFKLIFAAIKSKKVTSKMIMNSEKVKI